MRKKSFFITIFLWLIFGNLLIAQPSGESMFFKPSLTGNSVLVPVEFEFYHKITAGDSGVGINGSFNGWGDVYKMHEVSPNLWKVTLYLSPARYEYKFVTYTDTVGQSGVTGWFTDPLNADFGGPYNNSYITVSDPMIYYFLPRKGSVIAEKQPEIRAKISWAVKSGINPQSLAFVFDHQTVPNAAAFFDTLNRAFSYTPPQPLTVGAHTATLSVATKAGDTAESATDFEISNQIISAPFTFIFDSKSPNFRFTGEVNTVAVKGDFNFLGETRMFSPDSDGVYTLTADMQIGVGSEYEFIVNGGYYFSDPDNPVFSQDFKSYVIKRVDPKPRIGLSDPKAGQLFVAPAEKIVLKGWAAPSDSNIAIDPAKLVIQLDGQTISADLDTTGKDTVFFQAVLQNLSGGRHVVKCTAADRNGNRSDPVTGVFGIYPADNGFWSVDGEWDDTGPGRYKYPSGLPAGSVNLRSVHVWISPGLDSLKFDVQLGNIIPATRIGFLLVNSLEGKRVQALDEIEVQVPDWQDRGVYWILADPAGLITVDTLENFLLTSRVPLKKERPISVRLQGNHILFSLPFTKLETILGQFNQPWFLTVFTYFKFDGKTFEVSPSQGGQYFAEDPNVYDVAFFDKRGFQKRILGNYIPYYGIGGPRYAVLASVGRGFAALHPDTFSAELSRVPVVKLRTYGGNWYSDQVSVTGWVSDTTITTGTFFTNREAQTISVQNGRFLKEVHLTDGKNQLIASVTDNNGRISRSPSVDFIFHQRHKPVVKIQTALSGGSVSFDGSLSYDPDGEALSFQWEADSLNPEVLNLGSANLPLLTVSVPKSTGEYYVTLRAWDTQDTSWARAVFVVSDSGAAVPNMDTWHPAWVDRAVVYEIFPRSFSPTGKLRSVTGRLDQLAELGITAIWFMPINPGPTMHGYAITDYYGINPDYGTKSDFRKLIKEAHKRGIKIIMDHVIQHTSSLHPFMLDAFAFGTDSPFHNFYMWNPDGSFYHLFTWVDLPSINFNSAYNRRYLLRMAKYWLENFNIDGYRCDVAWAVDQRRPGYWQEWRRELKAIKPDLFLLAEGDAQDRSFYQAKFDAGYDWQWYGELKNVLSGTGSLNRLNRVVQSYLKPGFPKYARPFRFLENHDEQRFIKTFGLEAAKLSAGFLLTSPGVPLIYAGQEVGETSYRGIIHWNDRYGLRPFYEKLIHIRRENPALQQGSFQRLPVSDSLTVYAYLREQGKNRMISLLNFSAAAKNVSVAVPEDLMPADTAKVFYLNDILNHETFGFRRRELLAYKWPLSGYQARILIRSDSALSAVSENSFQPPLRFRLEQNYPNPFNPETKIFYRIGGNKPVKVDLIVFNVLGQKVKTLVTAPQTPGKYSVVWKGRTQTGNPAPSGIYFYKLKAGNFVQVKKLLLLR